MRHQVSQTFCKLARVLLILMAGTFLASGSAHAQTVPRQILPDDGASLGTDAEHVAGRFPGLLVTYPGKWPTPDRDGHLYNATSIVYIAERNPGSDRITAYNRRFAVHAPDADQLPTVKRVARLLLLLLGEARERLRYDHPSNPSTVEVWLTGQPAVGLADAGGQQIKNEIYIFDLMATRTPIEWTREVAHEYGHYALPGVSGFTDPEEWANGVLGERLFLRWLSEDLHAGKLHPEEVSFATPDQIDEYVSRQVTPLLRRIARDGIDPHLFKKKDAAGMDYYTGFALYLDAVYGSATVLDAMAYTTPREGSALIEAPDFYRGALTSLAGATELTITPPLWSKESRTEAFELYLPRGNYTLVPQSGIRSFQFPGDARGVHLYGKDSLQVNLADWQKITLTLTPGTSQPPHLVFRKPGVEVP